MEKVPSINEARAAFDELTRQLVLEKRYAVLTRRKGDRPPELPADTRDALAGFEARSCTFPELEALLDVADRVLILSDGTVLEVAMLRLVLDKRPLGEQLKLEKLVELGGWFTQPSTTGKSVPLAVSFQIYEVHPGAPGEEWRLASQLFFRRGLLRPRVSVGVTALDAATGRPWTNVPLLSRLGQAVLVHRVWRERHLPDDKRHKLLERSGFHPIQALLGGALGALLGSGLLALFLSQYVLKGDTYAAAVALSCAVGAVVSVKSCRICRSTIAQSMAAGLLSLAGNLAAWWWLGLPRAPALAILAA